jgi:hypothetical protein
LSVLTPKQSRPIAAAARLLMRELGRLLGPNADQVGRELRRLLALADAGENVDNEILCLLAVQDKTRERMRELLSSETQAKSPARTGRLEAVQSERNVPGAKSAAPDALIRRTPHLDAPEQLPTTVGSRFKVEVWTDKAPARIGEVSEDVVIEAPPEIREIELGVLLTTSPHLAVEGDYFQTLTVIRDASDSERVEFFVTVSESDAPAPASLVAQFLYRGRPCGRVLREWSWPSGELFPSAVSTAGVPVHTGVEEPDLSVVITTTGAGRFTCSVSAPALPGPEYTAPVEWEGIRHSTAPLVSAALAKLVDRGQQMWRRRLALETAGDAFWKAAPKPFREALWRLIDARAAKGEEGRAAIYVASDEPLLPWEIMRPSRLRQNAPDETRPDVLGVEFALGRWVRGDDKPPPPTLPVSDSLLIAARYPQADKKLDPTIERDVLKRHFGGHQLQEATYRYFTEHLENNAASLLHFVCHGAADEDDTAIFLDDWEKCTSAELRRNKGLAAACADRSPIVFLNACEGGLSSPGLGPGGAGFPEAFSALGARAIIAPLWPVTMKSAPLVAKAIYEQAQADPERPLADILAELRARSYDDEAESFDDSWAAYCLFGDPRGKLRRI